MNKTITNKMLYCQKQLPVFQNFMYDTEKEARDCPKGDVVLVEDLQTGLVYNEAFRPELMIYDNHYQNEQAVSPAFQKHLEAVSRIVDRCMGRDLLVEVGCGKGFFLEMLLQKGFDVTGFDPTYEGVNPKVLRSYFSPGIDFNADGVILRHILEHVQDPFNFLLQLKEANGGSGKIYIEVPCFDWISKHRSWFDIFYEHVNYFRLTDFHRMFGSVVESGRFFGDQYLYVVADLAMLREPKINNEDRIIFPDHFEDGIYRPNEVNSNRSVVWGGASKGVIFALLKERSGHPLDAVIDINPAKQGKYLPATGLLVQSPSDVLPNLPKGATIYVMNNNYLKEIKEMSNGIFNYVEVGYE